MFESDPALLREVGDALIGLLPERVDAVAGLELGSVPLATVVSQLSGLPTLFVRKKAKAYGTFGSLKAVKWQIVAWLSSRTS